jgi:hypothetical protein
MRTIALVAALALCTTLTQQAVACDWNKEVNASPVVVADSSADGGGPKQSKDEPTIQKPMDGFGSPVPQPMAEPCTSQKAEAEPAPFRVAEPCGSSNA